MVNKEVWCYLFLYRRVKPSKPLCKWKWCLAVKKIAIKAARNLHSCKRCQCKTALKQDKLTRSEGDFSNKDECTSNQVLAGPSNLSLQGVLKDYGGMNISSKMSQRMSQS